MKINSVQQFNIGCNSQCKTADNHNLVEKKQLKRRILVTSALGTTAALSIICHKQGFKLKNLPKTKIKDWALLKIKGTKTLQFEEKESIGLAGGSVIGGLAGGAIFDKKENFKAKLHESLSQMLGNVCVPIACVGSATRFYKKHEDEMLSKMPQFKQNTGIKKIANPAMKAIPPVGITICALAAGIMLGNKVSNFINGILSGEKQDRRIKGTDFAPHVDDLCLAITLMAPNTPVGGVIARTIPFFLTVPGYQTGIAQKK